MIKLGLFTNFTEKLNLQFELYNFLSMLIE